MINQARIYCTENQNPYRNLAVEEFLTLHAGPGEIILFLWQNRRTVVIGKNQNCQNECRVRELEEDGGFLARRLSGGGAVFHDLGNLNFSFCVRAEDYSVGRQTEVILRAVQKMGIRAVRSGRNDLTADGQKFSGNAFYRSGGHCCHHGTVLVDTDRERMARYLNVPAEKLKSNGVDSVRSRTVNLRSLRPDLTIPRLREALAESFAEVYGRGAEPFPESRMDDDAIARAEERFASPEWKYGSRIRFRNRLERRFPWGNVDIRFLVESGTITKIRVYTDAMDETLAGRIEEALTGCRCDGRDAETRLRGLRPRDPRPDNLRQDDLRPDPEEIAADIRAWIPGALRQDDPRPDPEEIAADTRA